MVLGFSLRSAPRLIAGLAAMSALVLVVLAGGARPAGPGGLIAFTRADGVYVMRADGTGIRLLRSAGLWTSSVSWSPDGRKLAYVSYGTKGGLWVMNADGSRPTLLVGPAIAPSRPTWSPDGRTVAFSASGAGHSEIWLVRSDGTSLRRLTTARWAAEPDWSPDGRRIVFARYAQGPGIYVTNVDGTSLRKLIAIPRGQDVARPDWSPDGRRIAFVRAVSWPGSGRSASRDELWVMAADGSSPVRLTSNHVPDRDPVWSPDGTRIAFVAAHAGPGSWEIFLMNADGTGFTRLTHNDVDEGSPAWQPVPAA